MRKVYVLYHQDYGYVRGRNPLYLTETIKNARVFPRKCDASNSRNQGRFSSWRIPTECELEDFTVLELTCEIK